MPDEIKAPVVESAVALSLNDIPEKELHGFGYASGGYMFRCYTCNTSGHTFGDKRNTSCRDCAVKKWQKRKEVSEHKYDTSEYVTLSDGVKRVNTSEIRDNDYKGKYDLTPEEHEILKRPIVQSLLYDLNLLPEQIQCDGKHWFYMLSILAHMDQAATRKPVSIAHCRAEVAKVKGDSAHYWTNIVKAVLDAAGVKYEK